MKISILCYNICGISELDVRKEVKAIMLSDSLDIASKRAQSVLERGSWPRFYFTKGGKGGIRRKTYLENVGGKLPTNFWPYTEVGHTDEAAKQIKAIFGGEATFDTPKPSRLIEFVLKIASSEDALILDSFAGSGTTAHAVLNMNKADGGHRKFILVEMGDYADTTTAERVKRENDFYEGKKATPADIAKNLPVDRPMLEGKIITSIQENIVTVIKASSGQGKTTLALRSAYLLQNEYTAYQVTVCDNNEQLGNTFQYFNSRLRLGEKLLILIDNLDGRVQKWNGLVQLLQAELPTNYKVLLTTREIDWYNYSGDLSNIRSINIIVPTLEEQEAKNIFQKLKETGNLHPSITNWKREWNRIAERKLLIEYVYLLTHGEMLSERITAQMKELGQSSFGQLKCDILRKVCFADVCGVKLTVRNLFCSQKDYAGADFGELLKNLESEFLIHLNTNLAKSIISEIGEYLWDYSMCRKLLAGPEDSDYGIEQLDFYRMAINEKMALLDLDESKCIEPVCLKVFSGSDFSSEKYNSLLNTLIFNNV